MSLVAHVVVERRRVDAELTVESGQTLALLGPNGSGKSTVLAAIAGLVRPDGGQVGLDSRTLHTFGTSGGTWLGPRTRRIALVTQRSDLFPAMSVLDNVAYGIRARGARRADARDQAAGWLERAALAELALRRPSTLSGGQARRVAVVRALASQPAALLLDEPFAGVDVEAAQALRSLVDRAAADVTTIIATHTVLDAHLLADAVAVLEAGRIVEAGPTSTVLTRPRTDFAAAMAGRVLVGGLARAGAVVSVDGVSLRADTSSVADGAAATVAVSPLEVRITDQGRSADVNDTILALEPRGDVVRVVGAVLSADVAPHLVSGLRVGDPVAFSLRQTPVAYGA